MSHHLTVQVLNFKGRPERGVSVKMQVEGWLSGGDLESKITDSDGQAYFETADDYEPHRHINISARGQHFGPFEIGGGSYTINV